MRWRHAALSLAVVFSACAGTPVGPRAALTRFPIGIYGVNDAKHLGQLRKDGFDSFHTYSSDPVLLTALAEEAKRQGMRMVIYPDKLREGELSATKSWPVDAWYLLDEPDVVKMSSAALQALSDKTRAWDPLRLRTFVIGQGAPAKVYGGVGDILMMDWYPVPHKPMDSVADQIDLVMSALPAGKPFWMVIQAYDWADEMSAEKTRMKGLRFPTQAEIRFMSYLSVLHGARGLFYFTLAKKGKTLFDYPELWQAVSGVSREIREMRPIFESGERIRLPFPIPTGGLEAAAWRHRGCEYLVLVNRTRDRQWKVPAEALEPRWRTIFAVQSNPRELLHEYLDAYYLRSYQVLVLKNCKISHADETRRD